MIALCKECYSGEAERYASPAMLACAQCGKHDDRSFGGCFVVRTYPRDPRPNEQQPIKERK